MFRLIVLAAVLLVSAFLIACEDSEPTESSPVTVEPTVTPQPAAIESPTATPTPTPAASPTQTPKPTPTTMPTPTPSPTPLPSPLIAYAQQCGLVLFELDSSQNIDDPASYTWGIFAQDIDQLVESYGGLIPPPELAQYHAANLSAWTKLRDAAMQRPREDSFANDLETLFEELADELIRVGLDPSLTDEERQRLFESALAEKLRDFYGQDTYASDQTAQEALIALPQEAREVLAGIECVPPLFAVDTDAEAVSEDRAALVVFYIATDGPNWSDNTNWLSDAPLKDWSGVTIGADGRVTHLILTRNQLSGEVPPELGNLSSLELLDLRYNQLRGETPPELGALSSLRVLTLSDNRLTGEIPAELGNLASLGVLDLGGNELSGKIPRELANLINLVNLSLGGNELTGEIPAELGTLTKLTALALESNNLTGEIPAELGNLTALRRLWLKNNNLTGQIPAELGNLTSLDTVTIAGNRVEGCPPSAWRDVRDFDRSGAFLSCP